MSTLYLAHFGLHEPPFSITPNPRYFFAGGERGRLLEALTIAVTTDEGITAVTGAVGSGKTLLARLLVARLSEMGWHVAYLANPAFAPNEIVAAIAHDLGVLANPDANGATSVAADPLPGATLLDRLNAALIARYQAGQRTAVVIDEAHAMTPAALDEVRRLANLETAQHKLLQIVLFAQPELTTLLADPLLLPLRERIVHRFTLSPLPKMTVAEYIAFRLRTAGLAGENPFTQAALNRIARASGGIARRINLLADKAMLSAFARGAKRVTPADVRRAERELAWDEWTPEHAKRLRRFKRLAATFSFGALAALAIGMVQEFPRIHARLAPHFTALVEPTQPPRPAASLTPESEATPTRTPDRAPSVQAPVPEPDAVSSPPSSQNMARNTFSSTSGTITEASEARAANPTSAASLPKPPATRKTQKNILLLWQESGYTHAIALAHWPGQKAVQSLQKQWQRRVGANHPVTLVTTQNATLLLLGPYRSASAASQALLELPSDVLLTEPKVVALAQLQR